MFRKTKLLYGFTVDTVRIVTSSKIVSLNNIITRSLVNHRKNILSPEDKFGNLATENIYDVRDEVSDEPEGEYFGKEATMKNMKACLDAHEYDNAVKLLRNIQKREKAPTYAYKLLLSYNAKLGKVEEAFKLYNDYKKRGYFVRGAMYTSLFTACGNCKRSDIALPIAYKLAKYLFESKDTKPNLTNFHAMLKAFGRHGDLSAAFQLVDRLIKRKAKITTETFNMLLEACITDRASGLRFGLLVWHHMLKMNIRPDAYTFRNMAKCAHNCSLGDVELLLDFVKMIVDRDKNEERHKLNKTPEVTIKLTGEHQELHKFDSGEEVETKSEKNNYFLTENLNHLDTRNSETHDISKNEWLQNFSNNDIPSSINTTPNSTGCQSSGEVDMLNDATTAAAAVREFELPNLLDPSPKRGSAIDFDDLSTPECRFLLFGGLKGFFKVVDHFNVKPDIKLFNILLYCIPPMKEAEEELLAFKEKYKIKTDVRFVNVLLRRRILKNDNFSFQNCLDGIDKYRVSPDAETTRILAEACRTREEGMKCIELARRYRIRLSDRFIYALLRVATNNSDLDFISDVLAAVKEEGIQLSPKCLALLGSTIKSAKLGKSEKIQEIN